MKKAHVKKDDVVVAICGGDKHKSGKVVSVDYAKQRVIVEGLNMHRRAIKPTQQNQQGGLEMAECPIHVSNVMLKDKFVQKHPDVKLGKTGKVD